ncbi:PD40 domain-containing protein [Chitinivibrio alkaliphilus]|uniref:Tol biopolymer transport system periplasmic component n=1 Tax=Chitinivibrio alkaliphilus ACht1 TaxID=1313304 RepID=U7DB71_9BACT|nr:PD40 domain-containing protein [Chitinivibrio alkaliphilus]ERP39267.1 Tol biopolymer transport system periplasmic component [Chitinivibrio alkaliphilus ACht1]
MKFAILLFLFTIIVYGESPWVYAHKTLSLENFSIHYPKEYERYAHEVGKILEDIYPIFTEKYGLVLPNKTDVIISRDNHNSWAAAVQNTISIGVEPMDFNLRGTSQWLENVVTHEFSHIASISTGFKFPAWMPYIQAGTFSHPNEQNQVNGLYIYPSDILPPWFFEGIAQYDSKLYGTESWDSHRDMILRAKIREDSLMSWDDLSVFRGRADAYEMVYNHGFSLVSYINEMYGDGKVQAILRASSRVGRGNFDRSIEEVLGISGRELYDEWKSSLQKRYEQQVAQLGDTTEARAISNHGFNNFSPRFSEDGSRLFYLSNAESATFGQQLYSYNLDSFYEISYDDTVRSRLENHFVTGSYDILNDTLVTFSSTHSPQSRIPHSEGGGRYRTLYRGGISPTDSAVSRQRRRSLVQMSENGNFTAPSFSPTGDTVAAAFSRRGVATLALLDTTGSILREIPDFLEDNNPITALFSTHWAPQKDRIAFDFLDRESRSVAWYDLRKDSLVVLESPGVDARDPFFSHTGDALYFASDQSGIFNIYRHCLETNRTVQVTNVTTGAFSPAVDSAENRLAYTGYTAGGYHIFLKESLPDSLFTTPSSAQLEDRSPAFSQDDLFDAQRTLSGSVEPYRALPRRPLIVPTLMHESILSREDDLSRGISHLKYGVVANILDPLSWNDQGNAFTAFYLTESLWQQFRNAVFFDSYNRSDNKKIAYDLGLAFHTGMFPVDMDLFFFFRNVPATNEFVHDYSGEDVLEESDVSIQPSMLELKLSHALGNSFRGTFFTSYLNQNNQINISPFEDGSQYLRLQVGSIFRQGFLVSLLQQPYTERREISPYGLALRLQYDYSLGRFVDEERILTIENGRIQSNLNRYNFHTFSGEMKYGSPSFLLPDFDTEINVGATYIRIPQGTRDRIDSLREGATSKDNYIGGFPSFFQPSLILPGYSLSYRADSTLYELRDEYGNVTDTMVYYEDSLLVSDNIILDASLSYRVPLWPGETIDRTLGFLYFDRLFGGVNFGGALTAENVEDLTNKSHKDILLYFGTELRLQTIAFNGFPLSMSFRWDRGLDKPAPVGGDRFTFMFGFAFDNWNIIAEPAGHRHFDGVRHIPTAMGP